VPVTAALSGPAPVTAGEITVSGVSKSYGALPFRKEIVRDCTFTVARGKLTVMIGPSGCGKSTLIRLLAGFERPDEGTIKLDGVDISGPSRDRQVVFQETALFPWMTTYDNILYGPRARRQVTPRTLELAEVLLDKVGLREFRGKYPQQLSGGMQRRAELARALINDPTVMVLDEPFRGLDALTKELMWDYCARLFEESGRTHLFVTTDIDEALFLADSILVMANTPTALRAELIVDLPRPRKLADIGADDRANEIKRQALAILHEEAMRSFTPAGRAGPELAAARATAEVNR